MKILVIDEEFPFPLNTGKRLRTYNLIRVLRQHHQLTYLAYGRRESEEFVFMEREGFDPVCVAPQDRRQSGLRFYARLAANLLSPHPYIVTSHTTQRFADALRDRIQRDRPDIVLCEWTPYAIFLKDLPGATGVVSAHNIEAAIWRRYEQNEPNPARRWYISVQRAKVEAFEKKAFTWAKGATAVTVGEAEQIARLGVPYPVEVIDNGVDLDYFRPAAKSTGTAGAAEATESTGSAGAAVTSESPEPHHLVFTGSMDWRPNQDAVAYFVEEIFPLLRHEVPDAAFTVVGRKPPERIRDLASVDGVTVTGTVDDVRPYLHKAALFVVPLRIGGGSRLKILEAMAMEKTVVSTTVGAEGLRVEPGENIEIADEPEVFASAVATLLRDHDRRAALGRAGRELVVREYGWGPLGTRLHEYLEKIAGQE